MDIGTIALALSNVFTYGLGLLNGRRKSSAETESVVVSTATATLNLLKVAYEEKIKFLADRNTQYKIEQIEAYGQIRDLKAENMALEAEIERLRSKN